MCINFNSFIWDRLVNQMEAEKELVQYTHIRIRMRVRNCSNQWKAMNYIPLITIMVICFMRHYSTSLKMSLFVLQCDTFLVICDCNVTLSSLPSLPSFSLLSLSTTVSLIAVVTDRLLIFVLSSRCLLQPLTSSSSSFIVFLCCSCYCFSYCCSSC